MPNNFRSGQVFHFPADEEDSECPAVLARILLDLAELGIDFTSPLGMFGKSLVVQVSARKEFSADAFRPKNLAMNGILAMKIDSYSKLKKWHITDLPVTIEEIEMPVFISKNRNAPMYLVRGEIILRKLKMSLRKMEEDSLGRLSAGCFETVGYNFRELKTKIVPQSYALTCDLKYHPERNAVLQPGDLAEPYYKLLSPARLSDYEAAIRPAAAKKKAPAPKKKGKKLRG